MRPRRCSSTTSSVVRKVSRSSRVQDRQPVAGRSGQAVGRQPELLADVRPGDDAVAQHVPVPHRVAGAGDGQRLPLHVAEQALVERAAGEGVLHDREADQQDDEDQAAAQRRLHDVVVEHAGDRHPEPVSQTSTISQLGTSMMARS